MKLVNKLIISFLIVILLSTILGVIISNNKIDNKFDDYLKGEKDRMMLMITDIIENNYDMEKGIYHPSDIEIIAKSEGLYIRVESIDGESILETNKDYLEEKGQKLQLQYPKKSKEQFNKNYYKEENYDLIKNNKKIGDIIIGYYRLDNCNIQDLKMKNTIKDTLIETAYITLVIGIIMSIFLARHFSIPLKKMAKATNEIRKGNLDISLDVKGSTYEINQLSDSINYLVKTLESKDMLRKRLTSDMAHEIRTPLTTLQNTMEAFLYGIWEPRKERLESCYEEIIRLSKLVERLKNIAKLEEDDIHLNITEFNLTDEIRQLIDLFSPQYDNKDIKLDFNYDTDINIISDKDKIKQIIINLLNNSYSYTNQGGKVEVSLKKIGKDVAIAVKDNGIGISSKDLPFIFERFYRIDETRNRKTGGTGIGLTILKALVDALGGRIDVESELGKGSIFTVILPIEK
ncbi:sensor histidine kinase [Paramaledivibacter caminithermalis]|jgi:signal transduction histidine kinase|uniref:histidine kinase n=1 Tax=Paramaledivibacter caminithermalis (strain DSM 15212 / CIP 107654 / DViRD3) TaxID=1121301 RepID=A0A1M6TEM6_PARC5|nr:HAMP domain-containing sensor histidine kinase [Paramaledivibacter caminithermalis]SHK55482.1 Signal transduction histidine kinase [Paramaledivibacter caminithermalis DSM 15212]